MKIKIHSKEWKIKFELQLNVDYLDFSFNRALSLFPFVKEYYNINGAKNVWLILKQSLPLSCFEFLGTAIPF